MLERNKFTPDQLLFAIDHGEFENRIIESAPLVACIMTQSWCPQWLFMKNWLKTLAKNTDQTAGLQVKTYETEYNKIPVFADFRSFKEQVWNNWEVPYLRYYAGGKLIAQSNFVSAMMFLDNFKLTEKL